MPSLSEEEPPHSSTHQKCEYGQPNRYPDHCSRFRSQKYVKDIAEQIDRQERHSQPVTPSCAAPQTHCRQCTSYADGAHQNNRPHAHAAKPCARAWIKSPHGIEKTSRKQQRYERYELAPAPNKKNRLRAVIPIGRTSALVIVIVLVELCLFGIILASSPRVRKNPFHDRIASGAKLFPGWLDSFVGRNF